MSRVQHRTDLQVRGSSCARCPDRAQLERGTLHFHFDSFNNDSLRTSDLSILSERFFPREQCATDSLTPAPAIYALATPINFMPSPPSLPSPRIFTPKKKAGKMKRKRSRRRSARSRRAQSKYSTYREITCLRMLAELCATSLAIHVSQETALVRHLFGLHRFPFLCRAS